ncbi:MAG: GNAT family N-acetyltransferase [Erysipelotrichaceae bacterium]|nr:GNAT family N-acetyltransferase [Erysipelotrichaceae bacterium]
MVSENNIRKAQEKDLSRIAEITVFVKRIQYRPIFQDDNYSFNKMQVITEAEKYAEQLDDIWVYDDGIVKGMIHIEDKEIVELYVDHFFQDQYIGSKLIEFAKERFNVEFLWAMEKNINAIRFYRKHGFEPGSERKLVEDTAEYVVKMVRNDVS